MGSVMLFVSGFLEVVSEFWILILGAFAGLILLYAMHLGRRGETSKTVPTYAPSFALGAFGFDMIKKSPFLHGVVSIAFLILCAVMVYVLILNAA